ncbi:hypothetical protein FRC01_012640 [Tulasnella sp. 417]|nr:hypothetical protein FRC01_012640 [Tulasnella sp. 417]
MPGDPSKPSRMLLNTIKEAGYITFEIENEETGPPHERTWSAVVTVTSVDPSLSNRIYIGTPFEGTGSTKIAAHNDACEKVLSLLAECDIRPGKKSQVPKSH